MSHKPIVLSIAGHDPDSGAGIQADLKTFSSLGAYGLTVITSITIQNTKGVYEILPLPAQVVYKQAKKLIEDFNISAIKIGMLGNSEIAQIVSKILDEINVPTVLDTIIYSKNKYPLIDERGLKVLKYELIPKVTIITPNIDEASFLTGINIRSYDDVKRVAKVIVEEYKANAVVIKGGHLQYTDKVIDVLYYKGKIYEFKKPRLKVGKVHGTGCVFSSALAVYLAYGYNLIEAVKYASYYMINAIKYSLRLGKGNAICNSLHSIELPYLKYKTILELREAIRELLKNGELVSKYSPEVQIQFAYALPKPYAEDEKSVAGVLGRIIRIGKKLKCGGPIAFGASQHVARAILKIMEFYPEIRSAINLKYSAELIKRAKEKGFVVSYYDRREEPPEIKAKEGATIPWGIERAIKRCKPKVPDLVYHLGDWGKEPMILIFGKTPKEVLQKLLNLIKY